MTITLGIVLLITLFVIWKLFVDGWLFKIILFCAGWFGLYALLQGVDGAKHTALTLGATTTVSWAALIPTIVCLMALWTTRDNS